MNQGGYYGAYRQGFKTLPDNAYAMMTAPTQINAETIKKAASSIGSMVQKYADQQAGSEASQQGASAQYKGLESISQATGVPMNPELADQFKNMGGMSPQQQAVFQNSLGQEAQRMQMLYGINQAQARAAQAQGQMQGADFSQSNASRILGAPMGGGGSATYMGMPMKAGVAYADTPPDAANGTNNMLLPPIQNQPSVPVYGGAYDNFGRMMPRVGTVRANRGF
jgi:hypothetical protein